MPDIKEKIGKYQALRILWDWEQVVHEAITDTTQALADAVKESISADGSGDFQNQWMNDLLKVLRVIVEAETGKTATKVTAPRALFMYDFPPIFVYGLGGMWIPIFNSRFQFGVPVELVLNKPLCRIRSQALVDIQAWTASQGSRPGKLCIE